MDACSAARPADGIVLLPGINSHAGTRPTWRHVCPRAQVTFDTLDVVDLEMERKLNEAAASVKALLQRNRWGCSVPADGFCATTCTGPVRF